MTKQSLLACAFTGCLAVAATAAAPWSMVRAQTVESTFTVEFALGSARLDAAAQSVVADAAAAFLAGEATSLRLVGHTDTTGSADFNQRLSEQRARAVGEALVDNGVPADAIRAQGVGQRQLIVPTADNVREQRNRVVVIDVLAPTTAPPTPEPPPAPAAAEPRFALTLGPYYGFDFGPDQQFVGVNLAGDWFVTPNISVGAEQAGFYNFGRKSSDDGIGGRSVASADYHLGGGGFLGSVGANAGYIYGSGVEDDLIYGPEVGVSWRFLNARVAWDIRSSGIDESVVSTTIGGLFRF